MEHGANPSGRHFVIVFLTVTRLDLCLSAALLLDSRIVLTGEALFYEAAIHFCGLPRRMLFLRVTAGGVREGNCNYCSALSKA